MEGQKNNGSKGYDPLEAGLVTIIVSLAALLFSLGTLLTDAFLNSGRNRNLLFHDLQVDGKVFHDTLLRIDRLHCKPGVAGDGLNAMNGCRRYSFFEPSLDSHAREILLQRAESLEKRITSLLAQLHLEDFGYITPVDYRTLAKEELKDLNFDKARSYIRKEVHLLEVYKGHSGYVQRQIHADLIKGWFFSIQHGKSFLAGQGDFDQAVAKAESRVEILPMKNYLVVFILQSKGCAQWIGESLFAVTRAHQEKINGFLQSGAILRNEPRSERLLHSLRNNQRVFDSMQVDRIMSVCTEVFDQI
ncbi:MAG: hypothetical protein ACYC9S_06865 [Leptospirales bacterium]